MTDDSNASAGPNPESEPWLREVLEEELDRDYFVELSLLQVELLKLQAHVMPQSERVAILFEGRDTAGKGGAISRFSRRLRPRQLRVAALPKPTDLERGQWYFQRYVRTLPNPGKIVLFDLSWYNRAVVEPVMGFCTEDQYERFMEQVVDFERMPLDEGLHLVKLWFSIDRHEQQRRLERRRVNPLMQWKLSTVDLEAQRHWESFTHYKEEMFRRTSMPQSPWTIVEGNSKKRARLESIRFVLSRLSYEGRGQTGLSLEPNTDIIKTVS